MPEVVLFEHSNFRGAHKHVFVAEPDLDRDDDNFFNDRVSSIVIVEGEWEFYRDDNFRNQLGPTLGRGTYARVTDVDIPHDSISSLRPV
jgi:hypothetical protein